MTKKYASFMHCGSYACRYTPFFDTVKEVEEWQENCYHLDDIWNHYIRPVANWQEVIDNRNSYNCDGSIPEGK